MAHTINDYLALLKALLPRGRAWNRNDPVLIEVLTAEAAEFARVDGRLDDLLLERSTLTTTELIGEHEADYGLPDGELPYNPNDLVSQRIALNAKLRAIGGQNPQYFIDLAAALGYTITITQWQPFWVGYSTAGSGVGDQRVIHYWTVNILSTPTAPKFGDELLSAFPKYAPANGHLLFAYYGDGFSWGFSGGFAAVPDWTVGFGFNVGFSPSGFNAVQIPTRCLGGFGWGFNKAFQILIGGGFQRAGFSNGFRHTN